MSESKKKLNDRIKQLETQELRGVECTLDMLIDPEDQLTFGLEKQADHVRNVQHIFCRLCSAFNDQKEIIVKLGEELERLKEKHNG